MQSNLNSVFNTRSTSTQTDLSQLSDSELIASFRDTNCDERALLVSILDHIAELDRRKLFFHYSSLKAYLVEEHGMEEWLAERRIRAARMMNRLPGIRAKLESGKLNLSLLEIAQGYVSRERLSNSEHWEMLEVISGISCKKANRLLASRFPQSLELAYDRISPVAAGFSEVRFIASDTLLEKIEEIRGLLAHSHPSLTLAELIDVLATEYRSRHHPEEKAMRAKERSRKQAEKEPQTENRSPSEAVKTPAAPRPEVHETEPALHFGNDPQRIATQAQQNELILQDGYQCAYVDPVTQTRCTSRFALETDHRIEWSLGGRTILSNLRFLCRNHHRRVSFLRFGEAAKYSARGDTSAH